jgi:hypothetical protein
MRARRAPDLRPEHGHRPELRQLLVVPTVSSDPTVRIRWPTGSTTANTADDVTHIPARNELVTPVGTPSFL